MAQPGPCGTRGHCLNTPGSFSCECHRGFTLDSSGHGCEGRAGLWVGSGPGLWSPGPPGEPYHPVTVSQTWMNVTGPIAVGTAVRTSWGATAVAAPRASPRTPSGASVWVSVKGPPSESVGSRQLGTAPTRDVGIKHNDLKCFWAGPGGSEVPTAGETGESGGCR